MGSPAHVHHGLLSEAELGDLYNSAMCGVALSATNPSRVPFEMVASGLPVVDLRTRTTSLDYQSLPITLAEPTPNGIADGIEAAISGSNLISKSVDSTPGLQSTGTISGETSDFENAILEYFADERPKLPDFPGPVSNLELHASSPGKLRRLARIARVAKPRVIEMIRHA